ncbi:M50 family metallopeptidase [Paracoccus sp. DMF-8]|uniref:M50 family metallopeptidase n=1 Tax=Paracoccus sp. DMF-8 TaxID=3019445 RepID=UPI003204649B
MRRDGTELVVRAPDLLPPVIGGVAPRSAASAAGLRAGDVILSVDGQPVERFAQIGAAVTAAEGRPVVFRVWRDGEGEADYALAAAERDLPTADGGYERRWLVGINAGQLFEPATRGATPVEALVAGVERTWFIIASSIQGLWAMITGQIGTCNLGGAISIAETTSEAASAGGMNFIWWIGVLSAAIGFLNLLPIPVLDGGHLMFFAYEGITGRPASDRVVNALTVVGLALVLTLMVFGLSNDLFCP